MTDAKHGSRRNRDERTETDRAMLLPIHPKWAALIYEGVKTIEVRRGMRLSARHIGMPVLLYETKPTGMVTGTARIQGFGTGDADWILNECAGNSCLSREQLDAYAAGRSLTGIRLMDARRFPQPVPLSELGVARPPQHYQYIDWERKGNNA